MCWHWQKRFYLHGNEIGTFKTRTQLEDLKKNRTKPNSVYFGVVRCIAQSIQFCTQWSELENVSVACEVKQNIVCTQRIHRTVWGMWLHRLLVQSTCAIHVHILWWNKSNISHNRVHTSQKYNILVCMEQKTTPTCDINKAYKGSNQNKFITSCKEQRC